MELQIKRGNGSRSSLWGFFKMGENTAYLYTDMNGSVEKEKCGSEEKKDSC